MTASVPAGWYPDPAGAQNSLRWWDGSTWSEHTQPAAPTAQPAYQQRAAQQSYQQPAGQYQQLGSYPPTAAGSPGHTYGDQRFEGHMQVGDPVSGGYRSPMTERNIFVSQKRKLIELTNEYSVFAQDGGQIGTVTEIGQSGAKKALRFLTDFDQFMTHRLEVRDMNGQPLIQLTRPAKVFKSTLIVARPDGSELGRLVQRNVFGKIPTRRAATRTVRRCGAKSPNAALPTCECSPATYAARGICAMTCPMSKLPTSPGA